MKSGNEHGLHTLLARRSWVFRPILWFATASMTVTIFHELSHASMAYVLGVRSTLFNYFADVDPTPAQAATSLPTLISVTGPLFCLMIGLTSWFAYSKVRSPRVQLPLLLLSVFGIGTFCGNLMAIASVGDFTRVADALRLPLVGRYAISAVGVCSIAAIHVWAGRELMRGVPPEIGRVVGTLGVVAMPVLLGTALIILVNQPMPAAFAGARAVESSLWLFAVLGALVTKTRRSEMRDTVELLWTDAAPVLLAVLVVRVTIGGIPFVP